MGQREDREGMSIAIFMISHDAAIRVAGAEPSTVPGVPEIFDQEVRASLEGLPIGWVPSQLIADAEVIDQPRLRDQAGISLPGGLPLPVKVWVQIPCLRDRMPQPIRQDVLQQMGAKPLKIQRKRPFAISRRVDPKSTAVAVPGERRAEALYAGQAQSSDASLITSCGQFSLDSSIRRSLGKQRGSVTSTDTPARQTACATRRRLIRRICP